MSTSTSPTRKRCPARIAEGSVGDLQSAVFKSRRAGVGSGHCEDGTASVLATPFLSLSKGHSPALSAAEGPLATACSIACFIGLVFLAATHCRADDTVWLAGERGGPGRTRLTGIVLEYTGRELVLQMTDGPRRTFAGARVVRIESQRTAEHVAGDELLAQGKPREALAQYQVAARREERRWMRRAILAGMIECWRQQAAWAEAGELFLALVGEDPQTVHFGSIPLPWLAVDASPALVRQAQAWLSDSPEGVAGLLGASHLLGTPERAKALAHLDRLAASDDPRIACLAQGQSWRGTIATATLPQLEAWSARLSDFPEVLRAGPTFIVGKGLALGDQPEHAALMLLRVPLLYPADAPLAAEALWLAGQALEAQEQPEPAARVYRELTARYPDDRNAQPAAERLRELPEVDFRPAAAPHEGEAPEARFLAGLRARRLFALAVSDCRRQLARPGIDPERQGELAVELSQTLVSLAQDRPPSERAAIWPQAHSACADVLAANPDHMGRIVLETQQGLVSLAEGELARQEAEATSADFAAWGPIQALLRQAINQLESTAEAHSVALRQAQQRSRQTGEGLLVPELVYLGRNVNYHLSRAYRNQGQTYPAASADRTRSMLHAAELLKPLAALDSDEPLVWQSRLDLIRCQRLLENADAAQAGLQALADVEPPAAIFLAAQAEALRLHLAAGELTEAQALAASAAATPEAISGTASPELDFACLEVELAALRAAQQEQQADQVAASQKAAVRQVRLIDQRHGPYWTRRAEALLAQQVSRATGSADFELLRRAADSFYRAGQVEECLAAFERLQVAAREAGDLPAAFDAGFTAAALLQEQDRTGDSAARFRQLALDFPELPRAGEAHLQAIYLLAQAPSAQQGSAALDSKQKFAELLAEHLARWPQAASASQVQLWAGKLSQRDGQFPQAVAAFSRIAADHGAYADGVRGMAESYRGWLEQERTQGRPTDALAQQAATALEAVLLGEPARLPERWAPAQRQAALGATEILLEFGANQAERAERILAAALASEGDVPPGWRESARAVQVVALTALARFDEAEQSLAEVAATPPDPLFKLVASLERQSREAAGEAQLALARLSWSAIQRLEGAAGQRSAEVERRLALAGADALSVLGRQAEALERLAPLTAAAPSDGEIQEAQAAILSRGAGREAWRQALAKWREVGRKSRPGGARWFRAMHQQAKLLLALEQPTDAARLLAAIRKLQPDLGGPALRAKFIELERAASVAAASPNR